MSSLTLITGTIDQAEDPFRRLDYNELYYETWKDDIDTGETWREYESVPIKFYSNDVIRIVQQKGSGKTLKAMDILAQKAYAGGSVAANLGLVWHNQDKSDKNDWDAVINTVEDFTSLSHCTALIDDVALWIKKWNTREAEILSEVSAVGRKSGLDMICTSQREIQIPPEIRDQATEWIVPIIRVRDEREGSINPDDNTGKPIELITLHFDGAKIFKYMSEPIIGLEPLMECYSTVQKAINLSDGIEGARPNQPGYELEAKAFSYLTKSAPAMKWQHLNGKHVFDIISDTHAIDIVGTDPDGCLILEHKDFAKHMRTAKRKGQKPYIMFEYAKEWKLVQITPNLSENIEGKRIKPEKIGNSRFKSLEKCI